MDNQFNDKFMRLKAFIEKAYLTSLAESGQNVVPLVSVGKKDGAGTKTMHYWTSGDDR